MIRSFDWNSSQNRILINPRMPAAQADWMTSLLSQVLPKVESHIFVLSSGTTAASVADLKWVALSKSAILAAADSANRFLRADSRDVWLHALPDFHVGGLAIHARAHRSGARVHLLDATSWSPEIYCQSAREQRATLSSLVPTQIFDLVRKKMVSPPSLRAVLVGGGALSGALYLNARALGWPLLPTFGMTEASSQVATAELSSLDSPLSTTPALRLLEHFEASSDEDGRLSIRGPSLLSFYVWAREREAEIADPKQDGWFRTEDCGELRGRIWIPSGRWKDRVKIGGELTHLGRLNGILDDLKASMEPELQATTVLAAAPDERLGHIVQLVHDARDEDSRRKIEELARAFESRVLPFERIRSIREVEQIERTELGKIKRI